MHHIRFNAREILEIAIRIEQNGAAFYRKAAAARAKEDERAFLLELAAMEEDHERIFSVLRDHTQDGREPAFASPEEDSGLYLTALADYHGGEGYRPAADLLTGNETLTEIIRIAIDLEQKSILYYDGLRPVVPTDMGLDQIGQVIAEERRHIIQLHSKLTTQFRKGG